MKQKFYKLISGYTKSQEYSEVYPIVISHYFNLDRGWVYIYVFLFFICIIPLKWLNYDIIPLKPWSYCLDYCIVRKLCQSCTCDFRLRVIFNNKYCNLPWSSVICSGHMRRTLCAKISTVTLEWLFISSTRDKGQEILNYSCKLFRVFTAWLLVCADFPS